MITRRSSGRSRRQLKGLVRGYIRWVRRQGLEPRTRGLRVRYVTYRLVPPDVTSCHFRWSTWSRHAGSCRPVPVRSATTEHTWSTAADGCAPSRGAAARCRRSPSLRILRPMPPTERSPSGVAPGRFEPPCQGRSSAHADERLRTRATGDDEPGADPCLSQCRNLSGDARRVHLASSLSRPDAAVRARRARGRTTSTTRCVAKAGRAW
jgi:hypothetical protein